MPIHILKREPLISSNVAEKSSGTDHPSTDRARDSEAKVTSGMVPSQPARRNFGVDAVFNSTSPVLATFSRIHFLLEPA